MYIEHPYYYDGKYYAKIDGEMVEVTREVAYAMNNAYRQALPKQLETAAGDGSGTEKLPVEVPFGMMMEGEYDSLVLSEVIQKIRIYGKSEIEIDWKLTDPFVAEKKE